MIRWLVDFVFAVGVTTIILGAIAFLGAVIRRASGMHRRPTCQKCGRKSSMRAFEIDPSDGWQRWRCVGDGYETWEWPNPKASKR